MYKMTDFISKTILCNMNMHIKCKKKNDEPANCAFDTNLRLESLSDIFLKHCLLLQKFEKLSNRKIKYISEMSNKLKT